MSGHGQNCASASLLKLGGQVTTSLDNSNDNAVYKIVLDKRGSLDVWADPNTTDIRKMELLDSSCAPIEAIHGGISKTTGKYAGLTVPSTDLFGAETVSTLGPGSYFVRVVAVPIDVFGETFTVHMRSTPQP